MVVRVLRTEEISQAVKIARGVFDYCLRNSVADPQQVENFLQYANEVNISQMAAQGQITLWGAFEQNQMIGMSGMQREGHITLLYVLPVFQHRGCGAELLETMRIYARMEYHLPYVTLNAMPPFTAGYFAKRKFRTMNMMQVNASPYISMQAKSIRQENYEKKPISAGWLIGTSVAGLAVCIAVAVGFMVVYMQSIV